jgi:hypothetical protein
LISFPPFLQLDHVLHLQPPQAVGKGREIWWSRRPRLWTKTTNEAIRIMASSSLFKVRDKSMINLISKFCTTEIIPRYCAGDCEQFTAHSLFVSMQLAVLNSINRKSFHGKQRFLNR